MSDLEYLFTDFSTMLEAIQTYEGRNEFIESMIERLKQVEFEDGTTLAGIDYLKVSHFLNSLAYNLDLFTKLEDYRKLVYALNREAWENLFVLSKRVYGYCRDCGHHDTDKPVEVCPECGEKCAKSDIFLLLTDVIMREKRGDKEISYRM